MWYLIVSIPNLCLLTYFNETHFTFKYHYLSINQRLVVVDSLLTVTPIVGFCNCSMFCCALLCVHFSIAIISMVKKAGGFALFVFLVSHDCCVALLHDAIGLSAVCDCGISLSYSLTMFVNNKSISDVRIGLTQVNGSITYTSFIPRILDKLPFISKFFFSSDWYDLFEIFFFSSWLE